MPHTTFKYFGFFGSISIFSRIRRIWTITVFSTIAMTGMKLIASETISPRNTTIVGLSAALGVGISQSSSALSQFPESITIIFGKTPVVIATIMAVLLNLILPQENTDQ